MIITLRIIGLMGILLFGTTFWFTYGIPGGVEELAKDFIKDKIEEETKDKINSLTFAAQDTILGQLAQKMMKGHEDEIATLKTKLQDKANEKTAAIIAEMRDLSCECREKYAQHIKRKMEFKVTHLQVANETLLEFMKTKYMEVVKKLTLDLRIFTGINLAVFSLLLIVSFFKPRAKTHLFLPGVLLVISTVICSYFYLFEQNWFFTIIYNDYMGFGFLGYVVVLFVIFCDIIFNSARVTTEVLNVFFEIIGSAFSVVSC
ncbi:MAG: hypothetical protein IPN42_12810 [Methylococcaceae bacterium]|nr:hypothetical protein [Methylococcaceae bacterium]